MNSADYQANTPYASFGTIAVDATPQSRTAFIRRTYVHLTAAIYGLVARRFLYFQTLPLDNWVPNLFSQRWGWLRRLAATWW